MLAAPALVHGLPVTAAYLVAGGTPVDLDFAVALPSAEGFLAGATLDALCPDATPHAPPIGVVARLPYVFASTPAHAVAVGSDGVAFRSAAGCPQCFTRTAAQLEPGEIPVEVEALAALAWQRLVLGLADDLGALRLGESRLSVLRCEAHG